VYRCIWIRMTAVSLGGGVLVRASDLDAVASNRAPLTVRHAVELALQFNAQLKATGAARGAERARGDALALAPQYRFGVEFENFAGSGELSGIDSLESALSLSSVLELGGKRERRRDVAATRLEVVDVEARTRQLDVAAEVARRYLDVVRREALVALAHDNASAAAHVADTSRARLAAARGSRVEVANAEIVLNRARLDEAAAIGALHSARVTLAEEALQLIELGHRSGRYSLSELTDAQSQLLDVRAQSIAVAADFFGVLIEIQRLTGEPVVTVLSED
jgi:outer membrane protein TolC